MASPMIAQMIETAPVSQVGAIITNATP
ncbi:hypothetical protein CCACVL1_25093 [Corchorus capsularis]|uniref:Uncharacterized protein n=1 Tax=Corchorus capsularis TaxID=210143 RepID=A0A1R3GLZ9_COCAP|nr:hypothetical protein CCACVL1_25093 [Corchorus capsularis]